MKVTLIGHACVLVETDEKKNILMDPVFFDPFEEGVVCSCPKRKVHPEKLPKLDLIVLSHAHLDHFDVPTLATLPRDVEVICPQDPQIPHALEKLGFEKISPTEPSTVVERDGYRLMTTFSSTDVVEFGVVFKDASGTFWNQVDTSLKPGTIELVKMQMGPIDLLFAMYASQNWSFFGTMRAGFPFRTHQENLTNVQRIAPKLVVPGSAGFRFDGAFAWSNAFLFPVSRERFLADLARVAPEIPTSYANPGDVFEIVDHAVTRHPAASPVSEMIEDDTHLIEFDATAGVPDLSDPNLDRYDDAALQKQVSHVMESLVAFVRASWKTDPAIQEYVKPKTSYGLGVIFPDGKERWLRIFFDRDPPLVEMGEGRLRGAMNTHRIAASALTAWSLWKRSYFFYRGFSRRSQTLGGSIANGTIVVDAREPPDLLGYWLFRIAPGADRQAIARLDHWLAPFVGGASAQRR